MSYPLIEGVLPSSAVKHSVYSTAPGARKFKGMKNNQEEQFKLERMIFNFITYKTYCGFCNKLKKTKNNNNLMIFNTHIIC